jgi:hypothetical protein
MDRALHWGRGMKLRVAFLGILMLTATLGAGAGEVITVTVSPAVAFAPATLVVRAKIEADARNRAVEIVAESPTFYRSSEIQLDGDRAPRTNTIEFRSLPSGTYDVKATLRDASGQPRAAVRSSVNIIESAGRDR